MMAFRSLLTAILFSTAALGHMEMVFPPPLMSQHNPHVQADSSVTAAYNMTTPLNKDASDFPCKGFLPQLGSPLGASVVTWTQGSSVNFTIAGGAPHNGGSCQAAISSDGGKSFFVLTTYQGGCPLAAGSFNLNIPSDTPTGPAVFVWLWYNRVGNREIYMNCASITITAGSGAAPKTAFSARPDLFLANLSNGCKTVEDSDVLITNPGPDAVKGGDGKTAPVAGTCAPVKGIGGRTASSGSSGSGGSSAHSPASSAPPASSSAPASSAPAPASSSSSVVSIQILPTSSATFTSTGFATSVTPVTSSAKTVTGPSTQPTSGSTSGLTPSVDGQCSGSQTCNGQTIYGPCCSQWGYCGFSMLHCGTGCMAGFGVCGINGTSSSGGSVKARHVRQFKL